MSSSFHRSSSSPNLTDGSRKRHQQHRHHHNNQTTDYLSAELDNDDDEFFVVGDRVYVDGFRPGSVAYFGEVDHASGDWVGVVLDTATGNHDGKVHGFEYFQCAPLHGLFVRPYRVTRMADSGLDSGASTSRTPTPLPTFQQSLLSGRRSKSPGCSAINSGYYYDDDYRQEPALSVASLTRKLQLLDSDSRGSRPSPDTIQSGKRPYQHASILKPARTIDVRVDNDHNHGGIYSTRREGSSIGSREGELSSRAGSSNRETVFNFRPKREQLDDESYSSANVPVTPSGRRSVNLATEPPKRGDRVLVETKRGPLTGMLRFLGQTNFALGEWAGVQLDICEGKNDGSVLGQRYFHCPKNYGLFVPANRVKKYLGSTMEFERMRSTLTSPPPFSSTGVYENCSRSSTPGLVSSMSSPIDEYVGGAERDFGSPSSSGYSSGQLNSSLTKLSSDYNVRDWSTRFLRDNTSFLNLSEYPSRASSRTPKFDERDLDVKVRESLIKSRDRAREASITTPAKPKAVEFTFTSSKYDGNPVARRTLVYE